MTHIAMSTTRYIAGVRTLTLSYICNASYLHIHPFTSTLAPRLKTWMSTQPSPPGAARLRLGLSPSEWLGRRRRRGEGLGLLRWRFCMFGSETKVRVCFCVERGAGDGAGKLTLTDADSYRPYSFISTILPVSPLIPHECSPFACFAYEISILS